MTGGWFGRRHTSELTWEVRHLRAVIELHSHGAILAVSIGHDRMNRAVHGATEYVDPLPRLEAVEVQRFHGKSS